MAQAIQLFQGIVKFPASKIFQTDYGERTNAVIVLENGEQVKLWGNPEDYNLISLEKGQTVQLAKNQKGNWQLATSATPATPTQRQQPKTLQQQQPAATIRHEVAAVSSTVSWQNWNDEEREALRSKIKNHANLMAFCLEQAQEKLGAYCQTSEDLRALATTLYISALKN
jgi:hypothetical protein